MNYSLHSTFLSFLKIFIFLPTTLNFTTTFNSIIYLDITTHPKAIITYIITH